jgi:hypothetical protein
LLNNWTLQNSIPACPGWNPGITKPSLNHSSPLSRDDTSILKNYGVPRAPKALRRIPFLNQQWSGAWQGSFGV